MEADYPTQRRELTIEHPPFELVAQNMCRLGHPIYQTGFTNLRGLRLHHFIPINIKSCRL